MALFSLLGQRRFSGLFWTQSIGAFTDSFFKQALLALVTERGLTFAGMQREMVGLLAGAVFMIPYLFFSATAGQLADKYNKTTMIRRLKLAEIFFAVLGGVAVYCHRIDWCMAVLVFFAIQSTFFGPIKYGILPQLLDEGELVTGNAWVETSTNVFILVGTIMGTEFIARQLPDWSVGGLLVLISLVGYLLSRTIPSAPSNTPELTVDGNPIVPTWKTLKLIGEQRSILNSILGISWFWALGGVMLSAFPFYTKDVLHCHIEVYTLLFVLFSVGIAIGSMGCERMSYGRLELGLVPFGSIGISIFLGALWLIGAPLPETSEPYTLTQFLHTAAGLQISASVFFFCVFCGFFIVPLYTLIQQRSRPGTRAQVIAGNNIVNAIFMVGSAGMVGLLRTHLGLTMPQVFGVLALFNAAVGIYIYSLIPEFTLRFVAYLITHFTYRLRVTGEENIPREGGLVLVANHVSFADWLVVMAAVKRPVHFVMWYTYFELPVVKFLFRDAGVIPISSARLRPKILDAAFKQIKAYLEEGDVVCIFPEGQITKNGQMNTFRNGVEKMVEDTPVPVVPMALRGLWGSNFSRAKTGFFRRFWTRPLRNKIEVVVGQPIPPEEVDAEKLQEIVGQLRGDRL